MEEMNKFKKVFGEDADGLYFAPGRVNLIGEHTDYNGGNVFPCSLTIGTYGAARKRQDRTIRLYSENFSHLEIIEISLDELVYDRKHDWANYPKGVLKMYLDAGYKVEQGFEIYYNGNIPNGAGLSSSASLEILTGFILKEFFSLEIEILDMVRLCQKTENDFIGVNSGIMDQFAVAMGKKDKAMLLDTNSMEYRYTDILLQDASIIVSNTNKQRGLQDSKYNERRAECEEALRRLQAKLNIQALGELDYETFLAHTDLIGDDVLIRRARHAVKENLRTLEAVEVLEKNDIEAFGQLMNESHESLKDDYEVTGVELDTLVDLARDNAGTIGSRMTGAGFGGCTVSIVRNEHIDDFIAQVGESYKEKIGYAADFYVVSVGDGVHRIM